MADARPARRTEVQHLRAGPNENLVHAAQNASSQLAPERISHLVLDFSAVHAVRTTGAHGVDGDALLAVYGLAGDEIFGDEHRLLAMKMPSCLCGWMITFAPPLAPPHPMPLPL